MNRKDIRKIIREAFENSHINKFEETKKRIDLIKSFLKDVTDLYNLKTYIKEIDFDDYDFEFDSYDINNDIVMYVFKKTQHMSESEINKLLYSGVFKLSNKYIDLLNRIKDFIIINPEISDEFGVILSMEWYNYERFGSDRVQSFKSFYEEYKQQIDLKKLFDNYENIFGYTPTIENIADFFWYCRSYTNETIEDLYTKDYKISKK
jgi:hypothetical protein